MIKVIRKNTLTVFLVMVMLLTAAVMPVSAAASTVTVPRGVTPVKSWSVVVGTTYKIPDDAKQADDTYASSNTAILTVNASTGQFTPQAAGVAYIVAANGEQSRYFKVTASVTISTTPATNVFDGYTVTVLDTTTVATGGYYTGSPAVYYFHSVDRTVLGSVSGTSVSAIQMANGSNQAPDGFGEDWSGWFAEQFNLYRGLSAGAGTAVAADNVAATTEQYRQEVIRLVNAEREKVGLSPYIIHEDCMEYSQIRASELMPNYAHTRPDGTDGGYEVIAAGPDTPARVVAAWMNSPAHKAALLNETRTYVGAGLYISPGGSYYWQMYFERDPDEWVGTKMWG